MPQGSAHATAIRSMGFQRAIDAWWCVIPCQGTTGTTADVDALRKY